MPAKDSYGRTASSLDSPLIHLSVIQPNDSADLEAVTRAIHVAEAGDLRVTMRGGGSVTIPGLTPGWHPLRVCRVHATGTTATGLLGGW